MKILVIDDEREILYALKAVFETQDWEALTAQNVKEGMELYRSGAPDLILIDYHMPHMNGMDGVRLFRRQDPDIPIIVFTIDEDQAVADRFLEAGASDFAIKPIRTPDILSRIRVHMKLLKSQRADAGKRDPDPYPYPVKGIGSGTMRLIEGALRGRTDYLTVEEISSKSGLANQTAYRYLQYLTTAGLVDVKNSYGKKGRPKQSYRMV